MNASGFGGFLSRASLDVPLVLIVELPANPISHLSSQSAEKQKFVANEMRVFASQLFLGTFHCAVLCYVVSYILLPRKLFTNHALGIARHEVRPMSPCGCAPGGNR